jgi:general secretion pathway protein E/type IV pilus assembly protein PilB
MDTVTLQKFVFSSPLAAQYPKEFISRRGAVKISEDEHSVHIAVVDGGSSDLYEYLESFHCPKNVRFSRVSKSELASYIGETAAADHPLESSQAPSQAAFTLDAIAQDAPVINIINAICIEAIRLDSSDIHIEAQADSVRVRFRIDGVLRTVRRLDKNLFPTISNRIKIMADMNTLEQRLPQDGRMTVSVADTIIDLRVSIIPITSGESIVLRIFNKAAKLLSLDELGFAPGDLSSLKSAVHNPHGLLILTGPTGSGKTTTLHALIETLPLDQLKIVTLEDPVEQIIPGVSQVSINDAIQLSFDVMLRRVLRQDPNVIMVGEIRDSVTAGLALRSALTGHLILSTLHTNDSVSVIPRLANMGIEPYLIAAVLRCAAAQRLVRKLCPACSKKLPFNTRMKSLLKAYQVEGKEMSAPSGCDACGHTGYKDRTVLGEVFSVSPEIENMIIQKKSAADIRKQAEYEGMVPMAKDALEKAAAGITSFEEIEREVIL